VEAVSSCYWREGGGGGGSPCAAGNGRVAALLRQLGKPAVAPQWWPDSARPPEYCMYPNFGQNFFQNSRIFGLVDECG
jgi:hypothetical protein